MIMRKLFLISMLVLLVASNAMALGPLLVFDPVTKTPYAYPGFVAIYTDLDPFFSLTGPVANADQDARVADAAAEWTGVPTASLTEFVLGDFSLLGLPDIDDTNFGLVLSVYNGGGYHIIYDDDGAITAALAGPGVLGFSSPEFAVGPDLVESYAVLNGSTVDPGDVLGTWWQGVTTHEMGHGINLAHTQNIGAIGFFGDDIGPAGCVPPYGGFPFLDDLETMYPFIDPSFLTGSGVAQGSVDQLDDMASISDIYPDAGWPLGFGTISGTIYESDGVTEVTGVNVIVRNVADPFNDSSSMLSGAFSQGDAGPDGSYAFHGLTPGASYVVYVDEIVAGGFSTPPVFPLPGPEEFYNGAMESGDADIDDKCASVAIAAVLDTDIDADIIFNFELNLGDDDSKEVALPFTFNMCGEDYNSVWVGSNGFVTFGQPDVDFSESVADLMNGPPRIAVLWDDFDPTSGGTISAEQVGTDFVITWDSVPQFLAGDSNTFSLTLRPDNSFVTDYPGFALTDGMVGRALGNGIGSDPGELDLSAAAEPIGGAPGEAVYELFDAADNDLSGDNLEWDPCQEFVFVIAPATMGVIYGTTGAADGGRLFTIDPATGAATLVGPTGITNGVPGLAINSSGEIWGAERVSGDLFRIDAVTAQGYFQVSTPDIDFLDALAFDDNDVLYGIGFDPPNFQLRTIDVNTGVSTAIGPTGDVYVGLAFHPSTNVLFASVGGFQPVNPDAISTIDVGTGAATVLGATGFGGATPDLVFDDDGNLYGVKGGSANFILIDQTDGSGAVIGPTGYPSMSGLASWVEAPVPTVLQAFGAKDEGGVVNLTWRVHTTGNDLIGFRVYRRDLFGDYRVVNESLDPNLRDYSDGTVVPGQSYVYKLEIVSDGAQSFFSPEVEIQVQALKLELAQNNPNPFNPITTIGYTVPLRTKVTLEIYDVAGRYVATLVNESRDVGRYSATWNGLSASGDPVGSGVYFYRLTAGNQTITKKMVLLK
jgi:hypothetical protein